MAVYGFHWLILNLFGDLIAGLVMDYIEPNWVWYLAGILSMIAIIGFWLLHYIAKARISKEEEPLNEDQNILSNFFDPN